MINIQTNSISSRNYGNANRNLQNIASGSRLNSASADPAGLSISKRLQSNIASNKVASRNINDGQSLAQTADSGLNSISNIMTRMKDLAVRANNGFMSPTDKKSLQTEFSSLRDEISHISNNTEFNGKKLLNNSNPTKIQVSKTAGDTIAVNNTNATPLSLGIDSLDISTNPNGAIKALSQSIDTVSSKRAELGAKMNRLDETNNNLTQNTINESASNSRIADVNYGKEISELIKNKSLFQAEVLMEVHKNANRETVLDLLR